MKSVLASDEVSTIDELLEKASNGNEVIIAHVDGSIYSLRLLDRPGESALDRLGVPYVNLNMTTDEIVQLVRDGRERLWDSELHRFVWPDEVGYAALAKDIENLPQGNRN